MVCLLDEHHEADKMAERSSYTGPSETGAELTPEEQDQCTVDAAEMQGRAEDNRAYRDATILQQLNESNSDADPDLRYISRQNQYLLYYGSIAPSHEPHVMAKLFPDLFPYG